VRRHSDVQNAEDQVKYHAALHQLDHLLPVQA
jgi:hypothetical protein